MQKENREPQAEPTPEEMRERVDSLRETDNKYEDSIRDLAIREDKMREKLEETGTKKKYIGEIANEISTIDLERVEAKKQKWIDDLTGLKNKNAYTEEVPTLLNIEKRESKHCSLLVIDFDFFKKVNDEYGHDAGDQALKKMSEMLKGSVRSSDIVYRYGGEEFIIFLPSTISSRAADLAEKIRKKIESSIFQIIDNNGKTVNLKRTISIGCVGTDQFKEWDQFKSGKKNESSKFLRKMFKSADTATIASKEKGRNQVTLFTEGLLKK